MTVSDDRSAANKSSIVKNCQLKQHCSVLKNFGSMDPEPVTVENVGKEACHLTSNIIVALKSYLCSNYSQGIQNWKDA